MRYHRKPKNFKLSQFNYFHDESLNIAQINLIIMIRSQRVLDNWEQREWLDYVQYNLVNLYDGTVSVFDYRPDSLTRINNYCVNIKCNVLILQGKKFPLKIAAIAVAHLKCALYLVTFIFLDTKNYLLDKNS